MLLDAGDYRGAVNRAYYAMFDLARHTLRAVDPKLAAAKKHSTIIARFSKYMIQERGYPREIGQTLRRCLMRDWLGTTRILRRLENRRTR